MVMNASVGKKATTAVLACALSVSLTPAAAYAGDGADANGGGNAIQVSDDSGAPSGKTGSGESGSGEGGSGTGEGGSGAGESGSGESGSGEGGSGESGSVESGSGSGESGSGESGSGEGGSGTGEGGSGSGESGSGESGSGEGGSGSGSGESGSGEGGSGSGESGSGEGGSGSGESGSGESGSGEGGSGSGESGSGSGESGSGEGGSGQGAGEGGSEVEHEAVLDLGDKATVVTVADIHAGETPCVKVKFAGDKSARDVSKDSAFEITFFGPDGSKTTEFDAVGTYKVRIAAASKDATTSAGEKVKGRTGLTMFKVEEKPANEEAGAPVASGNSGSGSSNESGAASGTASSSSSGSSDSTGSANQPGSKGDSSSSSSSTSKDKESSSETAATTRSGSGGTYHGGANGKVTYLGAVRLGSSGGTAQPGYVQRAAAGGAVAALGASIAAAGPEGGQASVAAYSLDDAATDVSALVAKAEGAELLFWGGGTEVAPLYIWDVSTKGMTRDDAFGLDLKVTYAGDESAVMKGAEGADATALSIGQAGALPDGCKLFWRTSSVFFDGESVDVYRFDPATGEYDLVEAGVLADGGYVSFSPGQGGEYLIVEAGEGPGAEKPVDVKVTELLVAEEAYAAEAAEPAAEAAAAESPYASDAAWAIPAALAAAVIAAGGVWVAMRRKLAAAAKTKK